MIRRFDCTLAVEWDDETAVASLCAYAGEVRQAVDLVRLRPEHNNAADAIRAVTNHEWRYAHDYELESDEVLR